MVRTLLYRRTRSALLLLVALALVACSAGQTPSGQAPQGAVVHASDKPRQDAASIPPSNLERLIAGNSAFAFDLYRALRSGGDNLLLSPYSISLALVMTYAGARGETERQMAEVLHFTLSQEALHPAFNALDQALAGESDEDQAFRLHLVNAIWGQQGHKFRDAYLDTLAENYGAGLRTLDFERAPEEARQAINDWASKETEERIPDLLPEGAIDPVTVLVLANAIYFKASWAESFMEEGTMEEPFALLDGTEVSVPTMRGMISLRYADGQGYQAVEIPYQGGEMAMLILLPEGGAFDAFAGSLDAQGLARIVGNLRPASFELHLPKFGYESGFELAQALSDMGMPAAFGGADFSGIDGTKELFIDQIYHKTFINVDEQGTEAAGATAVVMKRLAMPEVLRIDRPFVYLIRDAETGAILFLGQVTDPSA